MIYAHRCVYQKVEKKTLCYDEGWSNYVSLKSMDMYHILFNHFFNHLTQLFINVASHFNFTLFPPPQLRNGKMMAFYKLAGFQRGDTKKGLIRHLSDNARNIVLLTFAFCFLHNWLPRRKFHPNMYLRKDILFLSFSNLRHRWLYANK